ncbi:hypothetical protein AB0O76_12945 [Streptomyces sp. NPDC086554]|uniref:hypothetical protein n=1 Tax=Streptomyces sp. NPDC086554 TaxID=3154864 RepID=UPI003445C2A5
MRLSFRPFPAPQRAAVRAAVAVVVAGVAGVAALTGCAAQNGGVEDRGVAPSLSAPVSSSPLWPDYTSPPSEGNGLDPGPTKPYLPVKGVSVPAGGLRKVPLEKLLSHDPNVPGVVSVMPKACPGAKCGIRTPAYRDLTGDGADELVVAVDDPGTASTVVVVYRATGHTVRPILVSYGQLGLTGETLGRDLVLTWAGASGEYITRYRWNGKGMAPYLQDDEPGRPAASPSIAPEPQRPTATPSAGPDPQRPARPDPRPTP